MLAFPFFSRVAEITLSRSKQRSKGSLRRADRSRALSRGFEPLEDRMLLAIIGDALALDPGLTIQAMNEELFAVIESGGTTMVTEGGMLDVSLWPTVKAYPLELTWPDALVTKR